MDGSYSNNKLKKCSTTNWMHQPRYTVRMTEQLLPISGLRVLSERWTTSRHYLEGFGFYVDGRRCGRARTENGLTDSYSQTAASNQTVEVVECLDAGRQLEVRKPLDKENKQVMILCEMEVRVADFEFEDLGGGTTPSWSASLPGSRPTTPPNTADSLLSFTGEVLPLKDEPTFATTPTVGFEQCKAACYRQGCTGIIYLPTLAVPCRVVDSSKTAAGVVLSKGRAGLFGVTEKSPLVLDFEGLGRSAAVTDNYASAVDYLAGTHGRGLSATVRAGGCPRGWFCAGNARFKRDFFSLQDATSIARSRSITIPGYVKNMLVKVSAAEWDLHSGGGARVPSVLLKIGSGTSSNSGEMGEMAFCGATTVQYASDVSPAMAFLEEKEGAKTFSCDLSGRLRMVGYIEVRGAVGLELLSIEFSSGGGATTLAPPILTVPPVAPPPLPITLPPTVVTTTTLPPPQSKAPAGETAEPPASTSTTTTPTTPGPATQPGTSGSPPFTWSMVSLESFESGSQTNWAWKNLGANTPTATSSGTADDFDWSRGGPNSTPSHNTGPEAPYSFDKAAGELNSSPTKEPEHVTEYSTIVGITLSPRQRYAPRSTDSDQTGAASSGGSRMNPFTSYALLKNYAYIETSYPRRQGDIAVLRFKDALPRSKSLTVQFAYSMRGQGLGTLELLAKCWDDNSADADAAKETAELCGSLKHVL